MISDSERRVVAARLREQRVWDIFTNFENCIGDICDAVFDDEGDLNDMFRLQNALADLIEPEPERTCKMTWHCSDTGGSAYTCSNCGRDTYPFSKSFEHCPHCTAKVIE